MITFLRMFLGAAVKCAVAGRVCHDLVLTQGSLSAPSREVLCADVVQAVVTSRKLKQD